jgi:uncharacterized membrane protein
MPEPEPASTARPNPAATPAHERHVTVSNIVSGLPDNIAGMLAYFIVPAIVFLLVRPFKRNRFVRFHSIQCLLTVAVLIVLQVVVALLGKLVPLFVLSLYGLLLLAEITLWLLLLYKAYQNERFKLPLVGDIAETWADRS